MTDPYTQKGTIMKKLLLLILTLAMALGLTACIGDDAASVGIIGGADGPTAIFVTKK